MKTYELTYIISPEITSEEATARAREIESAVQSKEGTILSQSNPIAKSLAYPIEKRASGFVCTIEFQMESEKVPELEEAISKDGNIVRHMVIIKEPLMAKKERRSRTKPVPALEVKKKVEEAIEEEKPVHTPKPSTETRGKVELKDIEQKLDELLGE